MKKTIFLAGSLLLSGSVYFFHPFGASTSFPDHRKFQIVYKFSIEEWPPHAQQARIWVPLASSRDGQKILQREIKAPRAYRISRDPVYGNEMAYLELQRPLPERLDVEVTYLAEVAKERFERENSAEGLDKYLKPSTLMVVNDLVRQRTEEVVRGKKTVKEKARAIYDAVITHMRYDKTTPGWGRGDTVRACLLGKGNCTDFHSLFISMAHAAGIPARFKIGLTVPAASEGKISGYHCWAEFYEEAKGWQPVDASEAWKHPERKEVYFGNFDTNKFLINVGRDINLVPKQKGPPLNIFFYPYVEVDGRKWGKLKTAFEFKNLKS